MTNYDETRPAETGSMPLRPEDRVQTQSTGMPRLDPGQFEVLGEGGPMGGPEFWDTLDQQLLISQPHSVANSVNDLCYISHGMSYHCGWWHNRDTGELLTDILQVPAKLALIHSEISEALEAARKNSKDDKLPHRPGIEVELADALHRIFDLAGALGLDLGGAYVEKCEYNAHRADHKRENRQKAAGKAY